jgi:CHAD domain-containing protein
MDYLNAQIDQVVAGDVGLRRGEDPIHDTRVAIRRLRSTLRVFGKVLDPSAIGDMDGELKWFAGLLGDVRDCQVQQHRFSDALDGVPDELIMGPVKSRIRNDLQAVELPARQRVTEAMESERYQAMLAVLQRWRAEPPVEGPIATSALRKRARRAQHKADRRLAAALDSGEDAMLHRARKAAKRARYAAELCKPLDQAKRAKRTIKHYKNIQSLLGDHQDTAVASDALRRMGVAAGTTAGENGFTYGMLYAREQQIARQCRQDARHLR